MTTNNDTLTPPPPVTVPESNAEGLAQALAGQFGVAKLAPGVAPVSASVTLTERQQVRRVRLALLAAVDALWPDVGELNAAYTAQLGVVDALQRWLDNDAAEAAWAEAGARQP